MIKIIVLIAVLLPLLWADCSSNDGCDHCMTGASGLKASIQSSWNPPPDGSFNQVICVADCSLDNAGLIDFDYSDFFSPEEFFFGCGDSNIETNLIKQDIKYDEYLDTQRITIHAGASVLFTANILEIDDKIVIKEGGIFGITSDTALSLSGPDEVLSIYGSFYMSSGDYHLNIPTSGETAPILRVYEGAVAKLRDRGPAFISVYTQPGSWVTFHIFGQETGSYMQIGGVAEVLGSLNNNRLARDSLEILQGGTMSCLYLGTSVGRTNIDRHLNIYGTFFSYGQVEANDYITAYPGSKVVILDDFIATPASFQISDVALSCVECFLAGNFELSTRQTSYFDVTSGSATGLKAIIRPARFSEEVFNAESVVSEDKEQANTPRTLPTLPGSIIIQQLYFDLRTDLWLEIYHDGISSSQLRVGIMTPAFENHIIHLVPKYDGSDFPRETVFTFTEVFVGSSPDTTATEAHFAFSPDAATSTFCTELVWMNVDVEDDSVSVSFACTSPPDVIPPNPPPSPPPSNNNDGKTIDSNTDGIDGSDGSTEIDGSIEEGGDTNGNQADDKNQISVESSTTWIIVLALLLLILLVVGAVTGRKSWEQRSSAMDILNYAVKDPNDKDPTAIPPIPSSYASGLPPVRPSRPPPPRYSEAAEMPPPPLPSSPIPTISTVIPLGSGSGSGSSKSSKSKGKRSKTRNSKNHHNNNNNNNVNVWNRETLPVHDGDLIVTSGNMSPASLSVSTPRRRGAKQGNDSSTSSSHSNTKTDRSNDSTASNSTLSTIDSRIRASEKRKAMIEGEGAKGYKFGKLKEKGKQKKRKEKDSDDESEANYSGSTAKMSTSRRSGGKTTHSNTQRLSTDTSSGSDLSISSDDDGSRLSMTSDVSVMLSRHQPGGTGSNLSAFSRWRPTNVLSVYSDNNDDNTENDITSNDF